MPLTDSRRAFTPYISLFVLLVCVKPCAVLANTAPTISGTPPTTAAANPTVAAFQLLLTRRSENSTVTLCHTGTRDLAAHLRRADLAVAAAGVPGLVTADMVRPGAAVVDVGITRTQAGLVGDLREEVVVDGAAATPRPAGPLAGRPEQRERPGAAGIVADPVADALVAGGGQRTRPHLRHAIGHDRHHLGQGQCD